MLCQKKKQLRFCHKMPVFVAKLTFLRQKAEKLGLQKQLWQPEGQTFKIFFYIEWLKDQVKILKIAILSFLDKKDCFGDQNKVPK
jgi:hypothetical protein